MIRKFFEDFNLGQKILMVVIFSTGILYTLLDSKLLLLAGAIEFVGFVLSLKD